MDKLTDRHSILWNMIMIKTRMTTLKKRSSRYQMIDVEIGP